MKRKCIPIGTEVIVFESVDNPTDYSTGIKALKKKRLNPPVTGQVVGGTYVVVGMYYPPSANDYCGSAYVAVDKMVFVYLVRTGFINKPIKVLPESLSVRCYTPLSLLDPVPFRDSKEVKWKQAWKDELRDSMKSVPRDSKGRWMK